MKPKAIIFDIDSTLLDSEFIIREIHSLGLKGEEKWDYFYKHCNSDRVKAIPTSKYFTYILSDSEYTEPTIRGKRELFAVIICTARNEKNKQETEFKLQQEGIYYTDIYMRGSDDRREDTEVKRDLLKQIMEEYDIVAFIDDSLHNCEVAKDLGIMALRVV